MMRWIFLWSVTCIILAVANSLSNRLSMPININKSDVRIELFFQSPDDLRDRIQFLSSKGYKAFNIVNKNNRDTLIDWVDIVREASDEETSTSICVHYSAKYNKSRIHR